MTTSQFRHTWPAHIGGTVAVCLLAALVNYLLRGKHLGYSLLYSFMIGGQISALIWLMTAGLSRLLRRWRGDAALRDPSWVGWGWMLPCVLIGSVVGYTGGVLVTNHLTGMREPLPWDMPGARAALSIAFALLMSLLATALFYSRLGVNQLKLAQAQAERQAAEAQLTLLQSQLEPHMLFNTLAHLRVLIKLKPDEAQRMLDRLIDYLRATLQASRSTEHTLAEEFERLSDYLALMQIRMGERLKVQLDLPADLGPQPVPPLLLQPLVENAIKHGLEPHLDGGLLRVSASRPAGRLVLEVADSGAGVAHPTRLPGTGFGLTQVRQRLDQRYGPAARFDLLPQPGGGSLARIEIPA
ncbi:MAG: sensor histidine kinase [Burkholderiales bacterium]|nr:MAG: sensor histidine kinase [Burkholderiales bacterium]